MNRANTQTIASNVDTSTKAQKKRASKLISPKEDTPSFSPLPPAVISSVKLFVLFVGYGRSGSSITGSILDAHPNVIMANEFNVLKWVQENPNYSKDKLFNSLFENSYNNVFSNGTRTNNNKGYNLTVDNSWQGRYRKTVNVIGDKRGALFQKLLSEQPELFQALYTKLQNVVLIPIRLIHCVRNPYDIMSTRLLYQVKKSQDPDTISKFRNKTFNNGQQVQNDEALLKHIDRIFSLADPVLNMSQSITLGYTRTVEIHNHELVSHPEETILKLCQFLEIQCSRDYLRACASKVFPELSRSRFAVHWPEDVKKMVQDRIQKYPFFRRYSYDSDI